MKLLIILNVVILSLLRLPLLDNVRIKASGLTSPKLAVVIGDTYKSKGIYSSPVFTVSSFKDADEERRQIDQVVHVEGDAAKPGQYPLTAGMTLRSLMAAFGGSGQWGSKQRIIHTQGSKTTEYNYKKNPAVLNIRVKAGDLQYYLNNKREPEYNCRQVVDSELSFLVL